MKNLLFIFLFLPVFLFSQKKVTVTTAGSLAENTGLRYFFSATTPSDTTVLWINTSTTTDHCNPIHQYIQGAWNTNGKYYYRLAKRIVDGLPFRFIVTGQSNTFCSCSTSAAAQGVGDTLTNSMLRVWQSSSWVRPKNGVGKYGSSFGATQHVIFFRKLTEKYNRPVHFIFTIAAGQPLNPIWDNGGTNFSGSTFFTTLASEVSASGISGFDGMFWAQSEAGLGRSGDYVTEWRKLVDTLRSKSYVGNKLKILFQQSGDVAMPYSPDTARIERIAFDNDLYTEMVETQDLPVEASIHFTPSSHAVIADRLMAAWERIPVSNMSRSRAGYWDGNADSSGRVVVSLESQETWRQGRYIVVVTPANYTTSTYRIVVQQNERATNQFQVRFYDNSGVLASFATGLAFSWVLVKI